MSTSNTLKTTTVLSYNEDNSLVILTYFDSNYSQNNIQLSDISTIYQQIEDVDINEGDLYMNVINYPDKIEIEMNDDGEIVLFLKNEKENNYSIDENDGSLLYNMLD